MAPSGEPIFSPPAKALPPGTEWQDTQSPARARYSPGLAERPALSSARDVEAAKSKSRPQKTPLEIVVTFSAPQPVPAPTLSFDPSLLQLLTGPVPVSVTRPSANLRAS